MNPLYAIFTAGVCAIGCAFAVLATFFGIIFVKEVRSRFAWRKAQERLDDAQKRWCDMAVTLRREGRAAELCETPNYDDPS